MIVEKSSCIAKNNLESPKCTLQNVKDKYIDTNSYWNYNFGRQEPNIKKKSEIKLENVIVKNLMPIQQRSYTGNSDFPLNFENQSSIYQFTKIVLLFSGKPEIVATFKWNKRLDYNTHIL